jgi:hypothetical protein
MPFPLLPALALAQTGFQAYQGYKQNQTADELQRRGPIDNVPAAYKAMLQNQANQANNSQIAGYGQAIDNLNEQQSSTLGEAKRAGVSSSNLLNVLTRLNQQGSGERRRLAMAGSAEKERRQNLYNQGLLGKAQYQEQARQENNRAIGALRGAGNQNYYGAFTSGIGALGYGMEALDSMGAEKKMNALADKGYSENDFGGKTLDGISNDLIDSLPNRYDTERTAPLELRNAPTERIAPSYVPGYSNLRHINGY